MQMSVIQFQRMKNLSLIHKYDLNIEYTKGNIDAKSVFPLKYHVLLKIYTLLFNNCNMIELCFI